MSCTTKGEDNSCNKEDEHITDDMKKLHITCTDEEDDMCACCGKEGKGLNVCNKCKDAKYCNAACKKKHRKRHKNKCEKRVAELHEIELFKQLPQKEDCPICMLPLPSLDTGRRYKACCGKTICSGCIHAVEMRDNGVGLCPFCRTPAPNDEENVRRLKKRVEVGDAQAIFGLGCFYDLGRYGLPRDTSKALELYRRAGELGCAEAYNNIGSAYKTGEGVERDEKKADHYYELAAMGGDTLARYNMGCVEACACNWDRAIKHYMIAAGDGHNNSVKVVQQLYTAGHAKKDDYSKALLVYQKYLDEVRSEQRDKAAANDEGYKYY